MAGQRNVVIGVALFILIVGGLFGFAYLKKAELNKPQDTPIVVEDEQGEPAQISAVHFFEGGTHTIVGELLMPTPCDLINADAIIRESSPEQVTLSLETINNESEDNCAQVLTPQRFKVTFAASENASIDATLDGKNAILNMKMADPNQDPDTLKPEDFFFKG